MRACLTGGGSLTGCGRTRILSALTGQPRCCRSDSSRGSRCRKPRRERVVRGKQGQHAVLDEAGLDARRQIVGQQRAQILFQRRNLLDARAQGRERVRAIEHLGDRLRAARVELLGRRP